MDPEKKSLNFIFHTKYVIPKSLKFSHWPSKKVLVATQNIDPKPPPIPSNKRLRGNTVFLKRHAMSSLDGPLCHTSREDLGPGTQILYSANKDQERNVQTLLFSLIKYVYPKSLKVTHELLNLGKEHAYF